MGHSIATVEISAADAKNAIDNARPNHFGHRSSETSCIIDAAVSHWRDTVANRYDDARAGSGVMKQPMTSAQAGSYMNTPGGSEEAHHLSTVIPIVADSHAKFTTKKVKVLVTDLQASKRDGVRDYVLATTPGLAHFTVLDQPRRLKPVAVSKPGAARTEYVLMYNNGIISRHDSLAEARQAGIARAEQGGEFFQFELLNIQARQVKGDSAHLITFEQPYAKGAHYVVSVTVAEVKSNAPIESYLVCFDYHH